MLTIEKEDGREKPSNLKTSSLLHSQHQSLKKSEMLNKIFVIKLQLKFIYLKSP